MTARSARHFRELGRAKNRRSGGQSRRNIEKIRFRGNWSREAIWFLISMLFILTGGVLSENSAESSGRSVIVAEEPAETAATTDRGARWSGAFRRNQPVVQPLMIPLLVVVRDELGECPPEVGLAEENDAIQALFLN